MNQKRIDHFQIVTDHATKGPWKAEFAYNNGGMPTADFYIPGHNGNKTVEILERDANFICMAREEVPNMIEHINALRSLLVRLHDQSDGDDGYMLTNTWRSRINEVLGEL